jgi:Asp-tRNA(Asn)/Glu-tRNA(Gln) amidotransferase A subunit family amidase
VSALDLPLREQAAAIASGEADPTELLDETLARIEERNPAVNAIVETFPEESLKMLDEAPEGPLRGVPVAIKDEWPLPWRAEQLGSAHPPVTSPGESGPYLRLRDAGAVIVGVANMHEYGASSTGAVSVYGACRNPWDGERVSGGSSSGPGAAVGARIVAGAVGADGIGSIRYPAAYCGITGLKPTFRRSAMEGHHLDDGTRTIVSGPLAADAADCRLLGGVLFGEQLAAGDAAGIRIGIVDAPVWSDCDPEVTAACEEALTELIDATGGTRTEVDLQGLEHSKLASILVGQTEELHTMTPSRVAALGDEVSVVGRAVLKQRLLIPGAIIERSRAVRTMIRRSLAAAFDRVDVLAWPTVAAPAPPIENPTVEVPSGLHTADEINPRQCGIANLTGIPAISVPVGVHSSGLPMALQVLGPWGRDELLLDAAEALELATERRHVEALPPIAQAAANQRISASSPG